MLGVLLDLLLSFGSNQLSYLFVVVSSTFLMGRYKLFELLTFPWIKTILFFNLLELEFQLLKQLLIDIFRLSFFFHVYFELEFPDDLWSLVKFIRRHMEVAIEFVALSLVEVVVASLYYSFQVLHLLGLFLIFLLFLERVESWVGSFL